MRQLFKFNYQKPSTYFIIFMIFTPIGFAANTIQSIQFSDPTVSVKMRDANWESKKIEYNKKYEGADLSISLDQQQYPYLQPIIEKFAQQRNKTIAISDGTCGVSAGKLRSKKIDVGGFCCPPSKLDRLPGLTFHTLGIGSLALIANKDVPVDNVTIDQAKKIFTGALTSWGEVSKNEAHVLSISPIVRPHCDKRPGHWRLITPNKANFAQEKLKVGSIPDMLKRTSRDAGAIGYETLWMIDQHKEKEPVKVLSINGFDPTDQTALAQGKYPFYRTFSVTTWGKDANPLAKELIAYLIQNINATPGGKHTLVGVDALKENGWTFDGDELASEPKKELFGRREG